MAIHDTVDNGRSQYTELCIQSLSNTVDWTKHRLILIDNDSCERTKNLLIQIPLYGFYGYIPRAKIITNKENIGTANAVNLGLLERNKGEVCCKTDNDVAWHTKNWADELEEAILSDTSIGVLGLKRKDIWQHVNHENPAYRTYMDGKFEICGDIMGTCTALSPLLLDRVGFFAQCSPFYGADDVLMSARSLGAGFRNAFLPHIDITHLDEGGTAYTEWKKKEASVYLGEVSWLCEKYIKGEMDVYYDGGFEG